VSVSNRPARRLPGAPPVRDHAEVERRRLGERRGGRGPLERRLRGIEISLPQLRPSGEEVGCRLLARIVGARASQPIASR
jgi:hypothetical protein